MTLRILHTSIFNGIFDFSKQNVVCHADERH